ncbi:MAG: ABC transporter substrate-binding protein [Rhodospirillaceae bacterium]
MKKMSRQVIQVATHVLLLLGPAFAPVTSVLAETTLRYGSGAALTANWTHPYSSTSIAFLPIWSGLYDPLTFVSADGTLEPWLATAWQQTSPTTWTFTLRDNVEFSNGVPFNADAVVFAVDFLTSAEGRATPVGRDLEILTGARTLSPSRVELTTHTPDPLLPRRLWLLRIVEPVQWRAKGPDEFGRDPVGTGPFTLAEAGAATGVLRKAARSWRQVSFDGVDIVAISEASSRRFALETGRVDVAMNALSPDEFAALELAGGSISTEKIPAVVSMILNTVRDTPFRDERVRQAVTLAVDRETLVAVLLGGKTIVPGQPATRGMFGYDPDIQPLPYDPDKAKALLTEAGYPDGFAFDMEMPAATVLYVDAFQKVASDLRAIGVDMTVRQLPPVVFLDRIQTGAWEADAFAYPFFSPITDALYPMRYHSCLWHAPWYCDQQTTYEIELALAESDLEKREALTRQVMQRAHESAQALYMYESVSFIGLGPRVKNFRSDYGFIRYEEMQLSD